MSVYAVIPARGGSKGIVNKNMHHLNGVPLLKYTIDACKHSRYIDQFVISTDSDAIIEYCIHLGISYVSRPNDLAQDASPTLPAIQHAYFKSDIFTNKSSTDIILTLQPTSPLRKSHHIDEAIEIFNRYPSADSLVSCIECPHSSVPQSLMKLNKDGYLVPYINNTNIPLRRQEKDSFIIRNGAAIYITRSSKLHKFIFGGNVIPYFMNKISSIDIDDMEDLLIAQSILLTI